ncbi:MAG: clostripain-related cysteine peptidase, partial [Armatimonadota bacterium]
MVGSKSRQWTAITTEGFEGSFPPPLWEAEDGDSQPPEAYWGRDDWQEHSGNYSAYCVRSGAQGVDPAVGEYPNNASSWLVYGPFDLSDASQATLDFFAWIDTEADYDFFYWVASADGTNFDGWQISGNSSGWIAQDLDLSDVGDVHANMCGEPEVWIAFVFESDYSVTAKGVFVDDVLLQKSSGLGAPKLVNPINHTTLTTSYPPFEWRNVVAATGYEIIVDDSDAFTAPYVFSDADVTSTSVTPTSPIPDGTYYWKVRAKDGDTVGPWSQAWDFAVRTTDRPEWTFMVYLDADNNLESFGMDDLLEMVAAADNANVNICVLFDRALGYVTTYDNWTTTRRYKVTTATTPYDASPDYTDLGEMNMGDPQTVVDFVTWAQTNYPAEHYALIYWDHGAGWEPRLRGPMPTKIICIDSGSGNDFLELNELYDAMGAFPEKVDLCGMDACLMGQMEVAYHIRDRCDYFVASESSEPGPGWPYDLFLSSSQLPSGTEPAQLAARIVEAYRAAYDVYNLEATQSAWASDGLTTCANKVSALANELLTGLETYGGEIGAAWNAAVRFEAYSGQRAYIDLYGFCHYLRQNISDASGKGPRSRIARGINSAAGDLMDYLVSPTFQIAEWNDREAFGANTPVEGMSIYFPQTSAEYFYGQYNGANLRFVADPAQLWDEFLRAYLTGASPPSPPQALAAVDRPGDDGGAVELTWSRSPDDGVGDDDVTQYRIFRDHALIHTMPADDSPSYGYMDTGLQNGTEYCYMVRAYDGTMESPNSNTDCATPVANGGGPSIAVDLDPDAPGIQTARTVTQGANFDVAI